MTVLTAEQMTGPDSEHGEGPVWDGAAGRLYWVDLLAGVLRWLDPVTAETGERRVGDRLGAIRPRAEGGLVMALERQFALLDPDGAVHALDPVWDDPGVRFNDGGNDRAGRFYCGTMAYGEDGELAPVGRLFRLDPSLSVTEVMDGLTISNGIVWSADGSACYFIDSPTRRVDVLDAAPDGALTNRRPHVHTGPDGLPDGMCLDADGGLWVAMWQGSCVRRFGPDGQVGVTVRLPVPLVTACTFGGPDLRDLYITTSRRSVAPGEEQAAGAVFGVRPGVRGVLDTPFAG